MLPDAIRTRLCVESNRNAIPPVDLDDRKRKCRKLGLAELCCRLSVDLIGDMPVLELRDRFRPRERRALAFGIEVCGLAPDLQQIQSLLRFACGASIFRMHIEAVAAAVDLRYAKLHEDEQ